MKHHRYIQIYILWQENSSGYHYYLSVFIFDKFANVHLRRILVLAINLRVQKYERRKRMNKLTVFATKNMSRQYSTKNTTI